MKSFLLLLLVAIARRSLAFSPKAPVSATPKQLVQEQVKEKSSTALEAYAMGGYGYGNGNGLMYRSGGYGRYRDNYSGYGYGPRGYGYGGGLMPDSATRGYGGMYDRYYYNSPDSYYGSYGRYGRGYGG